jgi:hypothetical protein
VATEAVPAAVKEAVAVVHPIAGSNCGAARRRCGRGLEARFIRIHHLRLVTLAGEYVRPFAFRPQKYTVVAELAA